MPELPEVETIVRGLKDRIVSKKVIKIEIKDKKVVSTKIKDLLPFTITNVTRRAKYLLFHTNTSTTLLCHLRMTGHFHYPQNKEEVQSSKKYLAATFTFHDNSTLTHNSIRRLGFLKPCTPNELHTLLQNLGPEPLIISKEEFYHRIAKYQTGKIKEKLMDQNVIVGVGNIYAQEALYQSKIHPAKRIDTITKTQFNLLHKHIQQILTHSIQLQGTSVKNYSHLAGKGGYQNHLQIYQKEQCPKGHATNTLTIAGRGTYYCPTCQK